MLKKTALTISIIFHPLVLPLYGFYFLLNHDLMLSLMSFKGKSILMASVTIGMVLLPTLLVPLYRYIQVISSYLMDKREERFVPLTVTFALYLLTYFFLNRLPVSSSVPGFALAASIAILVNLIVLLKWKISSHAIGIGGIVGLVIVLFKHNPISPLWVIIALVIAGLVCTSRLILNAHTPAQVYAGLLTGLAIMSFTMSVFVM
jgi:membrane-associated phospholipid phosphatase